jgi:hypothetical protein
MSNIRDVRTTARPARRPDGSNDAGDDLVVVDLGHVATHSTGQRPADHLLVGIDRLWSVGVLWEPGAGIEPATT